ncbi:MAG TPA: filamentous hemagglutinin N-terminal domain-containing protein [Desulfuromonadales bacterium]|nr:filamentous hemagglutinin N-terminal domain-containing protein [Desulfuromonadales bacterium]
MSATRLLQFLVLPFFFLISASAAGAAVVRDGTIGPNSTIQPSGPDYLIPASHGVQAGKNLFHSFASFSIGTGETVTFTPDGSTGPISNIISRVTGGTVSSIDGLLSSSQITGANFYLLNPSGILIGPNASLDVGGSFHLSTADYLKFDNNELFHANPAANSVLSVAEPSAFGFLAANPASISGDTAYLTVPEGKTISLIGGDISYKGDPNAPYYILDAPGGRINIIGVASPGEVNLGLADSGISSFTRLGNVTLNDYGFLVVEGRAHDAGGAPLQPAGSVYIRGNEIMLKDSGIYAYGNPAGSVDIRGSSLKLDNYSIFAYSFGDVDHPGTSFRANLTQNMSMLNASSIESKTYGSGRAGDIILSARSMTLGDETPGGGPTADAGLYGAISSESAVGATGNGGNISVQVAGEMIVRNGFFASAASLGRGNAGNITLDADSLKFYDQGNISSNAYGYGRGGVVEVNARDISISARQQSAVVNSRQITGIGAQTYGLDGTVHGGKVLVNTDSLQLQDGGRIETVTRRAGTGADIVINAKHVTVDGFVADETGPPPPYSLTSIDARVAGAKAEGTGGSITIQSDSITLSNAGAIRSGLYADATGNAGSISINAKTIDITSRGQIYADSFRGTGNSGDISVTANSMNITGANNVPRPAPLDFDFTGLSTTTNAGTGGKITVALAGNLTATEGGGIKADTRGKGSGGAIDISALNVNLRDTGTAINALSTAAGNAGNINVTAANLIQLRNASITSEALSANGGEISLNALDKINLINSVITAKVQGDAQTVGGKIFIDPHFVVMKNSTIDATAVDGRGGTIRLVADTFLADPQSSVTAYSQKGISGTVDIQAPVSSISGLVSPLSSDYVSAATLLRERCIARIREGKYSSFVIGGRDGLPLEPGNMLPGFLF